MSRKDILGTKRISRTKLPKGFSASGINCGVRRYRPDLGVIVSESPCTAVAVFTKNSYQSVHIQYCKNLLPSTNIRAILTNSGQANTATGNRGIHNNQQMADALADRLHCSSDSILIASTGIIGQQVNIHAILTAIPKLIHSLSPIAEKFATAILTTDLVPKTIEHTITLSGGVVHITGICKGSGMIHPDMATMLGYFLCDAVIETDDAQRMLQTATDVSFNMISIDGETSTNDSVYLLSNGASGVKITTKEDMQIFQEALNALSVMLAQSIVQDGEGATKLFEVTIRGVDNPALAKRIARSLTVSPLLKTAIHGASPNWGRILSRIGAERLPFHLINNCSISIQGQCIFENGVPVPIKNPELLGNEMKNDKIIIIIDFENGLKTATAWGCDMSEKYVTINAEYLT